MSEIKHTDTSRSGDLKPCPFCGSPDVEGQESISNFCVACCNCGSRTGLVWLGTSDAASAAKKRIAIAAWNNRPADRIGALEAALRTLINEHEVLGFFGGPSAEAWDAARIALGESHD